MELRLHAPISHFMECTISKDRCPPSELWDLAIDGNSRLSDNENPGLTVSKMAGSEVHYIVGVTSAHDNNVGWQLTLDSPTTVLGCLQQNRSLICEIALYLLWSGRPF